MDLDHPGTFRNFYHDSTDTLSLPHNDVHSLFQDASGTIWLSLHNGLARLIDKDAMRFKVYMTGPEVEEAARNRDGDHEVWRAFERPEEPGVLWLGTLYGVVRFDTDTGDWARYVPDPDAGNQNGVFSVTQDPLNPGVLWIPTFGGGLNRFDIRTKSFVSYRTDPDNPNSLPDNAVGFRPNRPLRHRMGGDERERDHALQSRRRGFRAHSLKSRKSELAAVAICLCHSRVA